jgi:hypothetical protein
MLVRLFALSLIVLSSACTDETVDNCTDDTDCASGETCVSFDEDPSDTIVYLPMCTNICSSDSDCSTGCCSDSLCAPGRFCD